MQVSIETTTGLERRLTIGVPADNVDAEVEKRLKEASRTVRIDGFRPGKVPLKVVKKRYGEGVRQEVLGEVMSKAFYDAVTEKELKPAGQPAIEPKVNEEGKDFEFVATFEVYPEIELADLSALEVTKLNAEVTDADVDNMVEVLQKQQATWEAAEKAAAEGDQVNIDFEGFKDGEAFEGGTAEGTDLELGSNRMIPGFEDGLVGLKAGDEKTLELTFPEDYHSEELKGAAVEFKVKVNSVSERKLPELNDEFYEKFGIEGGKEGFLKDIRSNMERELKQAAKNKVKSQVMDGLIEANKVDVPAALAANEINVLRQQAMQQFGGASANLDASILPDELFKEQAERRVALGLLMSEFVQANKLTADKDKVKETIDEFASTYHDPEEVVNYYYSNEEQLAAVESLVLEDQVVEKILESAKVTEKSSTYDEVLKPDNAEA